MANRPKYIVKEDEEEFVIDFPVGFRFQPSDQEVILHYLTSKVFTIASPGVVIPESEVFDQLGPWDLPGDLREKRFFFTKRTTATTSSNICGYWKSSDEIDVQICAPESDRVVGLRKSYVYCRGNESGVLKRFEWVMQEFSLAAPYTADAGNWVICCVFKRKKEAVNRAINGPSPPLTPCSSGTTQLVSGRNDMDQEESSGPSYN